MSPHTGSARQVALRKLGRLFARLDNAVTRGALDEAKALLTEVRSTLSEARESEFGATNLNSDDVESR
jgi:hypothetical protein